MRPRRDFFFPGNCCISAAQMRRAAIEAVGKDSGTGRKSD